MKKEPNFNEAFEYMAQSDIREEIEEAVDLRLVTGKTPSFKEWMRDKRFSFCSITQIEVTPSGKPSYIWETPGANVCSVATRRGVLIHGQIIKYRGKKTLYATDAIWIGYFKQLGNYNLIFFKKDFVG